MERFWTLINPQTKLSTVIKVVSGFAIFVLLLNASNDIRAQATFVEPGKFKIVQLCKAYTSFRRLTGEQDLEANKIYTAYGENKAQAASHTYLDVNGQRKWASLECGHYEGTKPAFTNDNNDYTPPDATECLPFFDEIENWVNVAIGGRVDITPKAPPIEPFGEAVNEVCGMPGKITNQDEFKSLLRAFPELLTELMTFTGGKVYSNRAEHQSAESYLEDLTEAWYSIDAFDHIFCGEPKSPSSIGGLHYHGRYQQLQTTGELCRIPNYNDNEVVPNIIYTMGVRMKRPGGGWAEFKTKGYGLTLSAADILKVVTRAFAENPTTRNSSTGCILELGDAGSDFNAVFVRRATGIRTFFPDATPDYNRNPPCSSPIDLVLSESDIVHCDEADDDSQTLLAGKYRIRVKTINDKSFTLRVDECE